MSRLLTFFLAPATAVFLPQVYRKAAESTARRGLFYAAYWSFLITILFLSIFMHRIAISDDFMRWVKNNTPVFLWTREGLSLESGQSQIAMAHPLYGPIMVFDQNREVVTRQDMQQLYLFVTAKKIYFLKPLGIIESRDLTGKRLVESGLPPKIRITGEMIENFYMKIKTIFMATALPLIFVGSFLGFLLNALVYSLFGIALNLLRSQKLKYGSIFSMTCFAAGVPLTLSGVAITFVTFGPSFALFVISAVITLIYLAASFLLTDKS